MRVLLLVLLACHLCGWAQAQTATIQSIQATAAQWDTAYGTQGIRLDLVYQCSDAERRVSVQVPVVRLRQEGRLLYKSEQQVLPLMTNRLETVALFIPYREINLLQGTYQNIEVSLELADAQAQTTVSFEQPRRYQIEVDLYKAEIKQQLENYDQGSNPAEWLPDGYFALTTNGGTIPLYQSPVNFNSYELSAQKIKVSLLENEALTWSFFDRDGASGTLLGQYTLPTAAGDLVEDYYGQMFGQIKNLDFKYAQRTQARQAINIYSNNFVYQEKKGVALNVAYDLAQAYRGKKATAHFKFYDKQGVQLDVPLVQAMERTPAMDQPITLTTRNRLQYFVPFYVWKEACHAVEFYFVIEETGEQVRAARHILLEPFQFEDWVIDALLVVQPDATHKGAKGVRLEVRYELLELYKDAPLHIQFYKKDGTHLPFPIYYLPGDDIGVLFYKKHITERPRKADKLTFFIPYSSLNGEVIGVSADLMPDAPMHIFDQWTPMLKRPKGTQDAQLRLVKADERSKIGNYGQVIELKASVPAFYRGQGELQLEVWEAGKPSTRYKTSGLRLKEKRYSLESDSARLFVVFPHRSTPPTTDLELRAQVINAITSKPMSAPIQWSGKTPKRLFNSTIEIALLQCKFDKKIIQAANTQEEFPWEYVIEAGGDELARQALMPSWDNRKKAQYTQKVRVNREDDIVVKLHNTKTGKQVVIWKGDLSKWEQRNFKAELSNRYPVKALKISAKVPEDYNSNALKTSEGL